MYVLYLADDKRINGVAEAKWGTPELPHVETLPVDLTKPPIGENNIRNYLYKDDEYIYDPLPEPEPPKPYDGPTVEKNRADIDFIAMMTGVELEV